jgi:uncharacterized protein (DUF697 family)
MDELALAADLLGVTSERELDRVLGRILRAASPSEDLATSAAGRALRDILRREAQGALPALGGSSGMTLAEQAGALFGLEAEGLSPPGVEFEVARQLVRYASAAADQLAEADRNVDPQHAAHAAADAAARRFAPGLLSGVPQHHRSPTGGDMSNHYEAGDVYGEAGDVYGEAGPYGESEGVYGEAEMPYGEGEGVYGEAEIPYGEAEIPYGETGPYGEAEAYPGQEAESPLSEEEVLGYAGELVAAGSEQELDELFGRIFRDVTRRAGRFLRSGVGRQLGGILKGAVRQALPLVGGALGSFALPGVGTALGSQLGSAAGAMFETEFAGMEPEEQQFEVAQRLVQLAAGSADKAAAAPAAPPATIAQRAFVDAARRYAPGLARADGRMPAFRPGRRMSGRWVRRGNRIVVYGA